MSGWCPSSCPCGVWNGGGVCCAGLLWLCGVVRALPISVRVTECCGHAMHCWLPGVWCGVGGYLSVVFVWWGYPLSVPPFLVVVGGAVVDGGVA